RAPWNDAVMLKRLLDMGVQTLMVPNVKNKTEAEAAVAAGLSPFGRARTLPARPQPTREALRRRGASARAGGARCSKKAPGKSARGGHRHGGNYTPRLPRRRPRRAAPSGPGLWLGGRAALASSRRKAKSHGRVAPAITRRAAMQALLNLQSLGGVLEFQAVKDDVRDAPAHAAPLAPSPRPRPARPVSLGVRRGTHAHLLLRRACAPAPHTELPLWGAGAHASAGRWRTIEEG
ncbi:MAG: hypothetical protein ACPIOQ_50690, partial [Promethearchaeia archaeon]